MDYIFIEKVLWFYRVPAIILATVMNLGAGNKLQEGGVRRKLRKTEIITQN